MKRLIALLLTFALFTAALPALAEEKKEEKLEITYLGDSSIAKDSGDAFLGFTVTYYGGDTTITVTAKDQVTGKTYAEGSFDLKDGESHGVHNHQCGTFTQDDKPRAIRLTFKATSGKTKSYTVYQMKVKDVIKQIKPTRYANNTASSFGPHLRDLTPNLTDKWYMVTPLDLTKQGRQTYQLVAGNLNVIGEVYVDVSGDSVVLSYYNYYADKGGDTKTTSEFVTLFNHYNQITTAETERMTSRFLFNRPFSIQNDLGGDTTVLMLVVNRVNYCDFPIVSARLNRFWENTPENKSLRESLTRMIDWDGRNDPAPVSTQGTGN